MRPFLLQFIIVVTVVALATNCAHQSPGNGELAIASINQTLDDWHKAASEADADAYIGAMDVDGAFLGTDGTERWSTEEFADFVRPYFSKGHGWTYVPSKREISVSRDGRTAWFYERLLNDGYGELRGSGILVLTLEGWRIAQYNMTFVLPNGSTREVVRLVRRRGFQGKPPRALPAGTYYSTVTYRAVCDGCVVPRFAVIAGVFDDEAACVEPLKKLSTVPLQVGYPMIVHTEELAPVSEDLLGIAVVLGLFADRDQAKVWLEEMGSLVGAVRIVELLERDAAYDRAFAAVEPGDSGELVQARLVRIQEGAPVPAYSWQDMDAYEQEHGIGPIPDGALEPLCTIDPGTFFVVKDRTFNHRYYAHAPVKCASGEPALVSWRSTLLDTAIIPDSHGRGVLHQVVGAECDSPLIESWYYDEMGRYRLPLE